MYLLLTATPILSLYNQDFSTILSPQPNDQSPNNYVQQIYSIA